MRTKVLKRIAMVVPFLAFPIMALGSVGDSLACGDGYDIDDNYCNMHLSPAPCHAWTEDEDQVKQNNESHGYWGGDPFYFWGPGSFSSTHPQNCSPS